MPALQLGTSSLLSLFGMIVAAYDTMQAVPQVLRCMKCVMPSTQLPTDPCSSLFPKRLRRVYHALVAHLLYADPRLIEMSWDYMTKHTSDSACCITLLQTRLVQQAARLVLCHTALLQHTDYIGSHYSWERLAARVAACACSRAEVCSATARALAACTQSCTRAAASVPCR